MCFVMSTNCEIQQANVTCLPGKGCAAGACCMGLDRVEAGEIGAEDVIEGIERGEMEHKDGGATGEIGAPNGFGPEMLLDG